MTGDVLCALAIGLILGTAVGFFMFALCTAASNRDGEK